MSGGCSSTCTDEPILWAVEEIISKRFVNGEIEYYTKWNNFEESDNSWEPKGGFKDKKMIADFETRWRAKYGADAWDTYRDHRTELDKLRNRVKRAKLTVSHETVQAFYYEQPTKQCRHEQASKIKTNDIYNTPLHIQSVLSGLDRGWTCRTIIGVKKDAQKKIESFLVEWEETGERELVLAEQAREKLYQKVIQFFERGSFMYDVDEPVFDLRQLSQRSKMHNKLKQQRKRLRNIKDKQTGGTQPKRSKGAVKK